MRNLGSTYLYLLILSIPLYVTIFHLQSYPLSHMSTLLSCSDWLPNQDCPHPSIFFTLVDFWLPSQDCPHLTCAMTPYNGCLLTLLGLWHCTPSSPDHNPHPQPHPCEGPPHPIWSLTSFWDPMVLPYHRCTYLLSSHTPLLVLGLNCWGREKKNWLKCLSYLNNLFK